MEGIELSTYIEALREEITRCAVLGQNRVVQFVADKVEIELEVTATREVAGNAGAKVKFWVLEANSDARLKSASTKVQRLRLSLTPQYDGKPARIAGKTKSDS